MNKHTPGPWGCTTRKGSWDWVVYRDSNIEICQLFHDGTDMNETGEANARLIAAAPDMLLALKALLEDSKHLPTHMDVMKAARDAIGKAEGRDHD